ncbi:MAG: aspartate 1-decarboxylase [Planctomycetota bacterium]|nr:aspartate 1-decarboxylase [Planctomycetota bacterium]
MLYEVLVAKIHNAVVTERQLYYGGSITVDEEILERAGLFSYQRVTVVNLNNGARFDTFLIRGRRKSGEVVLNGPAARLGEVGDRIHILAYALADENELSSGRTKVVSLDEKNRIVGEETAKWV